MAEVILKLGLEELIFAADMDGMNQLLDEHLRSSGITHMATDINYRVTGTDGGTILVEATYVPEDDEDEDEDSVE